MASTVSHPVSALPSRSLLRMVFLSPMFDSVSAVLLPSLIALMISAAVVGHGHISGESVAKVLNTMAQASAMPAVGP